MIAAAGSRLLDRPEFKSTSSPEAARDDALREYKVQVLGKAGELLGCSGALTYAEMERLVTTTIDRDFEPTDEMLVRTMAETRFDLGESEGVLAVVFEIDVGEPENPRIVMGKPMPAASI